MTGLATAREAYRDHVVGRLAANPRQLCLDTDTGLFSGVDFGASAPRYLNLGIAEQNLMGAAAGLAAAGWVPYVNTMATFAATRAAEFVKIDIAYNALPVRIVATHGGVAAGHLGPTHQALEDVALMRALPNMTVVVPGDVNGLLSLLAQTDALPGPVYLRLGRKAEPLLPPGDAPVLGRLQSMRAGHDVVIVSTGPFPVARSLGAAEALAVDGISVAVLQAHTVKPFDANGLLAYAAGAALVVTAEEHWRSGGVGSAVAEILAEHAPTPVIRLGLPDEFCTAVAGQAELLDRAGLTAVGIAHAIRRALRCPPKKGDSP